MNDLPESVKALAECIGDLPALQLIDAYPGRRIYVPEEPEHDHPIAQIIGIVNARALARCYRGGVIELPTLQAVKTKLRNAEINSDARTMSHAELVGKWRLSRRHIIRILNKYRQPQEATE